MTPMGLKGFSLTATEDGIVIYGGVYWPETNLNYMDEAFQNLTTFNEQCLGKMNERSIIEQASAAIENTTYADLTILDMGTPRWTEQLWKTFDPCFNISEWPPFAQPI
jgi:hypothetical protein